MTPAQSRAVAAIEAELARLIRYDDESVVHEAWIRQRYQGGFAASYAPARSAAVSTAWHEAGHAVAALAIGARFSSASIRAGGSTSGRVHSIQGGGQLSFVIAAAGQVAERLRDWTLPESDRDLSRWLAGWHADGGDARRFRRSEEHTSELQSHVNLVCRLLLEKKKTKIIDDIFFEYLKIYKYHLLSRRNV